MLANLIVFAPRRRVTITLEAFPADARPPLPDRAAVNKWLEAWYNADTPREEPTFVPRHFLFGPRTHEFPPPQQPKEFDLRTVKPDTKAAVAQFVEEKLKRPLAESENAPETTLSQLGIDSLDAMEVALAVEQRFGFTGGVVPVSLGELWALAEGLNENSPPRPPPAGWLDPVIDNAPLSIDGETFAEAFLSQAFARPRSLVVADDLTGGITYEKLVVGTAVMAARFRPIRAANVGLMLPASVACDLAFLGLHLAGKVPVVLNWTTGPANLAHAAKVAGLTHVVTSKTFVDRVRVEVPGVEFLHLEDIRAGVGTFEKLRRLVAVRWFGGWYRRRLLSGLDRDPNKTAVILFTSGSEKAPKAVPLTHANVISDQRGCLESLQIARNNSAIGFLPMFHSFGLTVTGLLPLFVGVRIVHHPDPTDAGALVRKIVSYKPTLIAGTPTFIGFILDRAKSSDLDSIRLIVIGAEKCPPHVFEKAKRLAPRAEVVEGYGITECSPVVSVNRPGSVKPGTIGDPLPNVEVCITDVDTKEVLPRGKRGMIHVAGPTVFPGYLGSETSPFEEIDGKRWYITAISGGGRTGDRLPRPAEAFLKAGGDDLLPGLEICSRLAFADGRRPACRGEGIETPEGRRVVLFTTEDISARDANAFLQQEGFRGVMRLDDVKKLDKLPVLGTGKTDYKVLRAMIEEKK